VNAVDNHLVGICSGASTSKSRCYGGNRSRRVYVVAHEQRDVGGSVRANATRESRNGAGEIAFGVGRNGLGRCGGVVSGHAVGGYRYGQGVVANDRYRISKRNQSGSAGSQRSNGLQVIVRADGTGHLKRYGQVGEGRSTGGGNQSLSRSGRSISA